MASLVHLLLWSNFGLERDPYLRRWQIVDAPASSVSGTVNTLAGGDLRLGSLRDGASKMAGFLDEIRVSSVARGLAWAKHSLKTSVGLILSITTCNI